jgi:hypothetical protein
MQHLNPKDDKQAMAASVARVPTYQTRSGNRELPAMFDAAVLKFDSESAALAFDILGEAGQYGIVGRYTYVVTRRHVELLNEAKIPYEVQSAR